MKANLFISIIVLILLSFLSLSIAQDRVQTRPGTAQERVKPELVHSDRLEKAKPVEAYPDLVVDRFWLDGQCHFNIQLRNAGRGTIPDREHRESLIRVHHGEEVRDFPLVRVDPGGMLKRGGGVLLFNTQIPFTTPKEVRVVVNVNLRINEGRGEGNNEKTAMLTPACFSAKMDREPGPLKPVSKGDTSPRKSDTPLTPAPKIPTPSIGVKADFGSTGITLLSPSPNSTWHVGNSLNIEWKMMSLSGTFHINLLTPEQLASSSITVSAQIATYTKIQPNPQGVFKFSWPIPSYVQSGDYIVQVVNAENPTSYGTSGLIKIVPPPPVKVEIKKEKTVPQTDWIKMIQVTFPLKGSTFRPGLDSFPIEWKWMGEMHPQVKILLYPEGQSHLADAGQVIEITKSTPNDGSFNWSVPSTQRTGKYVIRVQTIDNKVKGDSPVIVLQEKHPSQTTKVRAYGIMGDPNAPPSIQVTGPTKGEQWALGKPHTIKWVTTGVMNETVKIFVYNPGTDLTPDLKGKTWMIIQMAPTYAGSCVYHMGIASQAVRGDVRIRVQTEDGKISGDSEVFKIGSPKISVSRPLKGETWTPLKSYHVEWTMTGIAGWFGLGDVNVLLLPVDSSGQKTVLLNKFGTPVMDGQGNLAYTGVLGNLPSGQYVVRVESSLNPSLYGESGPINVQSSLSSDTAFLGPDSAQNEVDLALLDVYFNGIDQGYFTAKVKNLGGDFSGVLKFEYVITYPGGKKTWTLPESGETEISAIIKANETKSIDFVGWSGFSYHTVYYPASYFIPQSGPLLLSVKMTPVVKGTYGAVDSNLSNNGIGPKTICKTPLADIGTDGFIQLHFSETENIYIHKGTTNQMHGAKIKWVSEDTFEARLYVPVWNYGCVAKTFDCWLYVGKLPGQFLKKMTLNPGEKGVFDQTVKIKVPSKAGTHSLVFIADPDENKNQPYPNAYMNNFINVFLNILPLGGTIKGSGL